MAAALFLSRQGALALDRRVSDRLSGGGSGRSGAGQAAHRRRHRSVRPKEARPDRRRKRPPTTPSASSRPNTSNGSKPTAHHPRRSKRTAGFWKNWPGRSLPRYRRDHRRRGARPFAADREERPARDRAPDARRHRLGLPIGDRHAASDERPHLCPARRAVAPEYETPRGDHRRKRVWRPLARDRQLRRLGDDQGRASIFGA